MREVVLSGKLFKRKRKYINYVRKRKKKANKKREKKLDRNRQNKIKETDVNRN